MASYDDLFDVFRAVDFSWKSGFLPHQGSKFRHAFLDRFRYMGRVSNEEHAGKRVKSSSSLPPRTERLYQRTVSWLKKQDNYFSLLLISHPN